MKEQDRETPPLPDWPAFAEAFARFAEQCAEIARNFAEALAPVAAELRRVAEVAARREGPRPPVGFTYDGQPLDRFAVSVRLPDPTVLPHTDGYELRDVKAPGAE